MLEGIDGLALREPHADYRRLFEENPLPMWIFDLDTLGILEVNEAAERQYCYSRQEFLRLTLRDLRPKEDVPRLHEHLPRTRDNPSPGTTAWRHRTKDGRLIDVEVTSFRVTFGGKAAKVVIVSDVTARKRSEQTIRSLLSEVFAAQEEERRRIALELHDGIAQSLASLLLGLSNVEEARSLEAARVAAAEQRRHIGLALDELKRIARGLSAEQGIVDPSPDVSDVSMPAQDGIETLRRALQKRPATRVLDFTVHDETGFLRAAISAGAGPRRGATPARSFDDLALLSSREREVLERVAEGYTNREVADELGLSIKSVEAYRARVMAKLGLRSRVELVRYTLECGVLRPGKFAR